MGALGIAGVALLSLGILLILVAVLPLFLGYLHRLPDPARRRLFQIAIAYGVICAGSLIMTVSLFEEAASRAWIALFAVLMLIFGSLMLLYQLLNTLRRAEEGPRRS